jgi:hypothetical protein
MRKSLAFYSSLAFGFAVSGCSSTPTDPARMPSAVDSLVILNHEMASTFAKRLCVVATESLPQGGTAEDRNCRNEVAKEYSAGNLQSQTKMAMFICDEMSSGPTWQRKAYNRLGCYRNAKGLIKNETLNKASLKCGEGYSDSPTLNQQAGDCYSAAIQDLDAKPTEN